MSEPRPNALQLPAEPNLRHLKDQAKDLVKCGRAPSLATAQFQIAQRMVFRLTEIEVSRRRANKCRKT